MARVCTVCGKGPVTGNNVSHANNRTKRRWYPNLQTVRVLVEGAPKRVRVCTQCLKSNRITKAPKAAAAGGLSRAASGRQEKGDPRVPFRYCASAGARLTRRAARSGRCPPRRPRGGRA